MNLIIRKEEIPNNRLVYQIEPNTIVYANNTPSNKLYLYASIRFHMESFRGKTLILTSKFFSMLDHTKNEVVTRFGLEYPSFVITGTDDQKANWLNGFRFPMGIEKVTKYNTNYCVSGKF